MSLPATAKALVVLESREDLKLVDAPLDAENIPADHVLIKVKAVGLNPIDWELALGIYGKNDMIAGCDACGDVVKVGTNVEHLQVGDRVAGLAIGATIPGLTGAFAEYIIIPVASVFKLPDGMSYEEASGFPISHLTAVLALYIRLKLSPPTKPTSSKAGVLVWGGSTAVGHHAIQLAALSGYRVFVTASPDVHDQMRALGATEVFNYKDADVASKIQAAAGAEGVTFAFDTIGKDGTTDKIVASMSKSSPNKIITVLPPNVTGDLPANTEVIWNRVFTMMGIFFNFGGFLDSVISEEDRDGSLKYIKEELPFVLEGWKSTPSGGKGVRFVAPKLRILEPGFPSIINGLKILKSGAYGREKLVCPL
ncbi:chaperonin 10-like protein [Flagelloscypha sp. PMI_526]|nr:chaperonin 10-like protein [Flagelloscypha sp. PMI_526]